MTSKLRLFASPPAFSRYTVNAALLDERFEQIDACWQQRASFQAAYAGRDVPKLDAGCGR